MEHRYFEITEKVLLLAADRANSDRSSQSDVSDDENSQSQPSSSVGTPAQNRPKKGTAKKQKSKKGTVARFAPASKTKIAEILIKISGEEMRESLEWLKESLGDAIEDYEVENNEGIPLVPVMDYAETAMESLEFQQLLKALGVCPPYDEQETYWRIPGSLTPQLLQINCDLIQQALDNTLQVETGDTETTLPLNIESSDDEDVFDKLRVTVNLEDSPVSSQTTDFPSQSGSDAISERRASPQFTIQEFTLDDNSESGISKEMEQEVSGDGSSSKQQEHIIESECEEEETETQDRKMGHQENVSGDGSNFRKGGGHIMDSDSEGEENTEAEKRLRSLSDSDQEKPVAKRSRAIIDSDED